MAAEGLEKGATGSGMSELRLSYCSCPSHIMQVRVVVGAISGSLDPLYYTNVTVAGTSIGPW